MVLESKANEVSIAKNGEEDLRKVKHISPELIILDIMLETGDKGFDVARELKRGPQYKDIPILMLTAIKEGTGLDFKREAEDRDWLPVDDYCDKPLKAEELIAEVERLLQK